MLKNLSILYVAVYVISLQNCKNQLINWVRVRVRVKLGLENNRLFEVSGVMLVKISSLA